MFMYFHRYNHIPIRNACGEALKPDNFKEIISGWKADCKDEEGEFNNLS